MFHNIFIVISDKLLVLTCFQHKLEYKISFSKMNLIFSQLKRHLLCHKKGCLSESFSIYRVCLRSITTYGKEFMYVVCK